MAVHKLLLHPSACLSIGSGQGSTRVISPILQRRKLRLREDGSHKQPRRDRPLEWRASLHEGEHCIWKPRTTRHQVLTDLMDLALVRAHRFRNMFIAGLNRAENMPRKATLGVDKALPGDQV